MLTTSEQVQEIAAALVKVQAAVAGVGKDATGQARGGKYRYATLMAAVEAIREPCSANGIVMLQAPSSGDGHLTVETRLIHTSGQWVGCALTTGCNTSDPQALGSAVTYLRRYTLMAILGLAPEDDDDGQAARGAPTGQPMPQRSTQEPRQATQSQAASEGAAKKAVLVTRVLELCEQTGTAKPRDLAVWDEAKLTAFGKSLREQLNKQAPKEPGFHDE